MPRTFVPFNQTIFSKDKHIRKQTMKQKAYQVIFPVTLVVVIMAFLSIIFFADVNPSFAASGGKKSSAVGKTTAVGQMKFRVLISQAHTDQLKKFIPPFESLYGSMSDQQKKDTDTILLTGRHGKDKVH